MKTTLPNQRSAPSTAQSNSWVKTIRRNDVADRVLPVRKYTAMLAFRLVLVAMLFAGVANAQTFTTRAKGDWTSPSTWVGGVAPTKVIAAGAIVNIRHEVSFTLSDDLQIYGTVNITGDTLRFPATFVKKTFVHPTGTLRVVNGGFIQNLPANQCEVEIKGGRMIVENSAVHVGKHFKNNNGHRSFRNSVIKVGEVFEANGSSSALARDTIQYSTLEVNVSHSGHLELKDDSHLRVANARIIAHNGDFKTATKTSVITLPGMAAGSYGFDLIKTFTHLEADGVWEAKIYTHCVDGDIKGSNVADIDFVRAEDCTLAPPPPPSPAAQLVMNEIYPDPADDNQEFFELYNMSSNPENIDNYTLITFFNENNVNGFYVLDFPSLTIAPRGFFVGTSAFPFSYQGLSPSMLASMNWNKLIPEQQGRLQKWVRSTDNNKTDGNQYYNLAPLPAAGLNDLFHRFSGDNAFTFFVYKNGILVNRVIAGAGGRKTLSQAVTSMPRLQVDMLGTAPDFFIDFTKYVDLPVENIVPDVGTDNGFIRTVDGGCGTWRKGSTSSKHTPMQSNGPIPTNSGGDIHIVASITNGTPTAGSTLNFSALGTTTLFPAELRVFVDNGSMPFQFDVDDQLVKIETANFSGQNLSLKFTPYDANIFIVAKQGVGCIDQVFMIARSDARFEVLPVRFSGFTAAYSQDAGKLRWTVEEEKDLHHYVVQRGTNGKDFSDVGLVFPADKESIGYGYNDKSIAATVPVYYYRIKAVDNSGRTLLSPVRSIRVGASESTKPVIAAYPNPVKDVLTISLPAAWQNKTVTIQVFDVNGVRLRSQPVQNKDQVILLPVAGLQKGNYLVQVSCEGETAVQKVLKL